MEKYRYTNAAEALYGYIKRMGWIRKRAIICETAYMNSYITRPIFPFVSLYVIFFTSRHVEVFNLYGWIPCVTRRRKRRSQRSFVLLC